MKKCELCLTNSPNKKNTHFLTDGIIRSCLNLDGSVNRENGFYFDISNDNAFVEFNFQRETSIEKLEEELGRQTTEEEIEKAKYVPFSVDYVFCSICEEKFTNVETEFINVILPKLRNTNLVEEKDVMLEDFKLVRLFFIIQIWRSHICETNYILTKETAEELRKLICNYPNINDSELRSYPISVTYLETLGGKEEYTSNCVGHTSDKNPYIIIMNDFLIQFFENVDTYRFLDFYGINKDGDFVNEVNYKEEKFRVNILHHEQRKNFLEAFFINEKVKKTLSIYADTLNNLWKIFFGVNPSIEIIREYITQIIEQDENNILNYTQENIVEMTQKFIYNKGNIAKDRL